MGENKYTMKYDLGMIKSDLIIPNSIKSVFIIGDSKYNEKLFREFNRYDVKK